ncbi:hypothetical protein OG455_02775 [Kitasatospora sp. NBC_01287]|uniref:hypothetical protein n=1 Tax=Kitasatospora sp. NBC_01287 TaxID=2903573 RepID=UPI002254DDE7|nr:hypothetical protein [Kitasatospora sp. NBC_01287]MCX4744451.1 hypothetical protein [Kitasatospora sp. NBC_01287]
MTPRADLLALTPETLAALANRGLVKRAAKELDAGGGPQLGVDADGAVDGRFPDGTRTVLPPGTDLAAGHCDCGAPGVCRHRIGLVLAYQRTATAQSAAQPTEQATTQPTTQPTEQATTHPTAQLAAPPPAFTAWSPGACDDEALATAIGPRALAAARRGHNRGYPARLHRPTPGAPTAQVELPTCTVRFPVPGQLGYAITEAGADQRGEVIALAVWAFRAADERGLLDPYVQLDVGGAPDPARGGAELAAALELADELLLTGTAHAGPVLGAAVLRVRDRLAAASLHWPAGALTELGEQLADHAARGAGFRPERVALLLAELHARHRAAAHGDATARAQLLGTREAGETALRRVRLTALGCRIGGGARRRVAQLFLAHPEAGVVLVLRRQWEPAEGQQALGPELAGRRLAGSTLGALAAGNVVSESATRSASRTVAIARGRIAATSVTPVGTAWTELPEPLLVRDFAAHVARLDRLPPALLRPRVEAEAVHVVEIAGVEELGYDPAEQQLRAVLRDAAGRRATLLATHNPYAPGALDALATALAGEVRLLSGTLRRSGGGLLLDPLAVLTADGVTVLDLASTTSTGPEPAPAEPTPTAPFAADPTPADPISADPISTALQEALSALADTAHRGLRQLDRARHARLTEAATRLDRTGLATAAALLRALLTAAQEHGPAAWTAAQLHVLISAELHQEGDTPADC